MLRVDKRDEGFAELRYMGTNSAGQAVFRRTDVDIGASLRLPRRGATPRRSAIRAGAYTGSDHHHTGPWRRNSSVQPSGRSVSGLVAL